jgi:group I intron endonuclease
MIYIGQTKNSIAQRFRQHTADSKRFNSRICNAIRKYGKENFIIEELYSNDSITSEELDAVEFYLIKYYCSKNRNVGYNIKDGGNSVPMTQETKDKISIKNKGRKCSEDELKVRKLKHIDRYSEEKVEEIRLANSKSNLGGKNPRAIKILHIESNEEFACIKDAANKYNINKATLNWQLKNNKTSEFKYLN